jgi:hypothetical protein
MTLQVPVFTQDQSYPAWLTRRAFNLGRSPGVRIPGVDYNVTPGSGIQVNVAAGDALVAQTTEGQESSSADKGLYYVYNDSQITPSNTVLAPANNPRVDLIVLQVLDVFEQSLAGSSKSQVVWVQGSENSQASLATPVGAPSPPSNSLVLAYVLHTVGESSIPAGNILVNPSSITSSLFNLAAGSSISSPLSVPAGSTNVLGLSVAAQVPQSGLVRLSGMAVFFKTNDTAGAQGTGALTMTLLANGQPVYNPGGALSGAPVSNYVYWSGLAAPPTFGTAVITAPSSYASSQAYGGGTVPDPVITGLVQTMYGNPAEPYLPQMRGAPIDLWLPPGPTTLQWAYSSPSTAVGQVLAQYLVAQPIAFY